MNNFYIESVIAREKRFNNRELKNLDAMLLLCSSANVVKAIPDNEVWILIQKSLPNNTIVDDGDEYTIELSCSDNYLRATKAEFDNFELYKYQSFRGLLQIKIEGIAPLPISLEFLKLRF